MWQWLLACGPSSAAPGERSTKGGGVCTSSGTRRCSCARNDNGCVRNECSCVCNDRTRALHVPRVTHDNGMPTSTLHRCRRTRALDHSTSPTLTLRACQCIHTGDIPCTRRGQGRGSRDGGGRTSSTHVEEQLLLGHDSTMPNFEWRGSTSSPMRAGSRGIGVRGEAWHWIAPLDSYYRATRQLLPAPTRPRSTRPRCTRSSSTARSNPPVDIPLTYRCHTPIETRDSLSLSLMGMPGMVEVWAE